MKTNEVKKLLTVGRDCKIEEMKTKQANREITVNNVRRFWTIFVKTFRELVASWNSFEFL